MEQYSELISTLQNAEHEIELLQDEAMAKHTTFAIGGPADLFLLPKTIDGLRHVLSCLRASSVPLFVLGNGSNVLVSDRGIRGAVVCTSAMDAVHVQQSCITAEAGALLSLIARTAQRAALSGAEFAGGIPGSLGGAVFMNAGAYDGQMAQLVSQTRFLDSTGEMHTLAGAAHEFGYRRSVFREHPDWTIVSSDLQLETGDSKVILDKMNDFAARRRDKQPLNFPSAGSTFKRPEGHFAGQLIEQAGLKGLSVGGAQVSEKHAGFLINRGGATCDEMRTLIETVQQRVFAQFGVELECEVRVIG